MTGLSLAQLRTFLAVARHGGIGSAARVLNLTQPAVTARIKGLEEAMGAPLLDRAAGPGRLTVRGELLLGYARRMEALADGIERDVLGPGGIDRLLRIGASETVAQSWLPDLVAALHARFPSLSIELDVDVSTALRERLVGRRVDLALLLGPVSEASVENRALPPFELAWYCAPGDARREDAADLFGKPVVTYARTTRPFREMREAVEARLPRPVALFPSASLSAAMRLVESGLGVGALPCALAGPWAEAGRLARFDPGFGMPPLRFTASFLADPPSHVTRAAAELAVEVAHKRA